MRHGRVGLPNQRQALTNLAIVPAVKGGNAAAVPGSDERSRRIAERCAICSVNCWQPPRESRPQYDAAMSKGGKKSGEKSTRKMPQNVYQAELFHLQTEFVRLQ